MNATTPKIVGKDQAVTVEFDWGQLAWFVNGELAPGADMTLGRCILKPGRENPRHYHPNCSEILFVVQGTIEHTISEEGGMKRMTAGDSISIPRNFVHQARNLGEEEAILMIVFSSAARESRGEDIHVRL